MLANAAGVATSLASAETWAGDDVGGDAGRASAGGGE
jgi:hypothetical protein